MKLKTSSIFPSARVILAGNLLLLGGCAWFSEPAKNGPTAAPATANAAGETNNANGQPYYVVKPDFTPLFRTGPAQPNGPDQNLPKDTLVTILKRGFGYSRVQVNGGLDGYVATEDIMPAPAGRTAPTATAASTTNTEHNSAIVEHYTVEKAQKSADTSTGNAEASPDLPEPRLEPEPTPVVKPDFRY